MLKSKFLQRLAGGRLEHLGARFLSWTQHLFLSSHKDRRVMQMIREMRRKVHGPMTNEAYILHSLATAQSCVPGDFAEVGVSAGGSARVICEGKHDKRMHLFDTFTGLPHAGGEHDRGLFKQHAYACSREKVEDYLCDFSNLSFHEGVFPDSVRGDKEVEESTFALAHFDVDLYEGTRSCLEFFYPRMNPGGVIITHDYSLLTGVKKAFDEFLADKPEAIIELPTTQAMFIKR